MPLEGPLLVVSSDQAETFSHKLAAAGAFPVLDVRPIEAPAAIAALRPSLVVVDGACSVDESTHDALMTIATEDGAPWTPVVVFGEPARVVHDWPAAVLAGATTPNATALRRLGALQRLRALHQSVRRRAAALSGEGGPAISLPESDPLMDATVLIAGRGRVYGATAVRIAERIGSIGALTLEAARDMIEARDIDALVIADGFQPEHVAALLENLAQNVDTRDLPVLLIDPALKRVPGGLTHLDTFSPDDAGLLPMLMSSARVHALSLRLKRAAQAIAAEGLIDPLTGLCTPRAFKAQLKAALDEAGQSGTPFCVARLAFPQGGPERLVADAARIMARLIRGSDFALRDEDGLVLALGETDLKAAHVVVRRLASILKHTALEPAGHALVPDVTLHNVRPGEDMAALTRRLGTKVA
jgi:hypothetical protein